MPILTTPRTIAFQQAQKQATLYSITVFALAAKQTAKHAPLSKEISHDRTIPVHINPGRWPQVGVWVEHRAAVEALDVECVAYTYPTRLPLEFRGFTTSCTAYATDETGTVFFSLIGRVTAVQATWAAFHSDYSLLDGLADKYQVSRSLIGLIVNRKIWKHLK